MTDLRRHHRWAMLSAAIFSSLAFTQTAGAQNPPPVQTFFIPVPEDQAFAALESIYPGNATCGGGAPEVQDPISTTISIAIIDASTLVYYDQWEDGGYDADIANPVNLFSLPGNPSGTQIWGDGDTTNGAPPGYPTDVFSGGDVIVLANDVFTGSLGTVDFDGRDKVATSRAAAVTRAAWAEGSSTLLAGAIEVFDTGMWGTAFRAPVGQDTSSAVDMFDYTGLVVMAGTNGTVVDIDADADGIDETTITLAAGESYHVDGGMNEGGTVTATADVQVHLITGDVCATYESRWFTMVPTTDWSDAAVTPVGTNAQDPTFVFVHNPGTSSITVEWTTLGGSEPSLTVPAGGTAQATMPDGSGARFFTTDGSPFFAVSTVDSDGTSNSAHDWGFSMIPEAALTQQVLVGWGPGQDPTLPTTENGAPVWVTPLDSGGGPIDICVDFDADNAGAFTDTFGNNYDLLLTLDELEIGKAFDPDGDQTGTILYVCDGSEANIAVAWGQDPDTASTGAPAIDVGTTVPPLPSVNAAKGVAVETDLNGDNLPGLGERLRYSIVVQNISRVPVSDVIVSDALPSFATYVAGSTELDDGASVSPVPDAGTTAFPLDEGGITLPAIPPAGQIVVTFLADVTLSADACGEAALVNQAAVTAEGETIEPSVTSGVYCDPVIDIEKSTNGADADLPTGPAVGVGDPVDWLYVVTNPGNVPLASVIVTDDQGVTVNPVDLDLDTFNDGDLDEDDLLDPGETWLYAASGTATLGQYANIGTASGTPVDEGGTPITDGDGSPFTDPSDDDPSHYLGGECVTDDDCDDDLFCNGVETCVANTCQAGTAPDCDDGVGCTDDSCDEVNDTCVNAPNDASCDDGLFCNGLETCDPVNDCQAGTAPDCDDGVGCTDDSCDEVNDTCVNAPNDASCDDGLFCNGLETCDPVNDCQAGTAPDCDDGVGCTDDSCDEVNDTCVNAPNDASCDDGLFCNGLETCDPVNDCQAGTAPDCDDGVGCTDDSCDEVNDTCVNAPNDASCDDGLFCNGLETCDPVNDCQAGTAPDCDDGVGCTDDSCDEVNDTCVNAPNDASCDDGLFCNGLETCDPVNDCQAGTAPDCDDGVGCTDDSCDEVNDTCVNAPNDASCDDGLFCNGLETCDPVNDCQAGTAPDCDDGVGCTDDSCDEVNDTCVNAPNDASCDDGLFCNGLETCDPVNDCQAGTAPDCDDGVGCTDDSCDEVNDTCVNAPNDASCDDGLFCNGLETCDPLNDCQAGTAPDCDDGVGCTDDSCDEVNDTCVNAPNDASCDDGLFCNGLETCDPVNDCQAGTAPDCDDGVGCTVDSCDEVNDTCVNAPNDASCDDGLFCNGLETCDPLNDCQAGTAPDCDDGVGCTVDSCDEVNDTCVNAPNDASCDDGLFCNGLETCDPVNDCQAGTAPDCDDGVGCTVDSCDEVNDTCVNAPNDASCDDGLFCNGLETCDPLNDCQAGTAPDCDDGVGCTDDSCDEVNDTCVNAPNDASCDDGLFCNGLETCDPLNDCQAGTAPDCDDGVGCTDDSCDEVNDTCVNAPNDASCDDGLFCNGLETCDPLNDCQAGTAANCDDGVDCTVDVCDEAAESCLNLPNDSACTDGEFCNGPEVCDLLTGCGPGIAVDCSAQFSTCSVGVCNETTDACEGFPVNEGAPCDDLDSCTPASVCEAGQCLASATLCGNGVVDVACSEQCEPGDGEICNDMIDNDGDVLIDCADPDCCENLTQPSCGSDCQAVAFCKPILNDPAKIKFRRNGADQFKFHGRVTFNPALLNPLEEGFSIVLSNANGVIYSASLLPGDFIARGFSRFIWKDKTAKHGPGLRDGLFRVRTTVRKVDGLFSYFFKIKAFGDFSAAIVPDMTTQVFGVDEVGVLSATWAQKKNGWILRNKDILAAGGAFQCTTTGP